MFFGVWFVGRETSMRWGVWINSNGFGTPTDR